MEKVIHYFETAGIEFTNFWQTALILLVGSFVVSLFGRVVFGKRSTLSNAVSSAFAILFLYAGVMVLRIYGGDFIKYITPLPLVTISGNTLTLFQFAGAHYTKICAEVLNMFILAFLVNLAERWLPKGKNVIVWLFFRILTVIIAFILHFIVVGLLTKYVPEGVATYAPVILVAVVVLLLLTGALKILVGAAISTVNPIIGALYTFFFANFIGKQITRAVLTTGILCGLLYLLEIVGVTAISIASAALTAYIPAILILVVLWYIVCRFL